MPGQRFPALSEGDHIELYGTWVLDTYHGWREIHPSWAITDLSTGRRVFSLPLVPLRYGRRSADRDRHGVVARGAVGERGG